MIYFESPTFRVLLSSFHCLGERHNESVTVLLLCNAFLILFNRLIVIHLCIVLGASSNIDIMFCALAIYHFSVVFSQFLNDIIVGGRL